MQATLSTIQAILSGWYQLTLANPLYAAAVAVVVWLLTAMLYSVRIASLKKKMTAGEQALGEIQNNLDAAQQQLRNIEEKMQQIQEELSVNKREMEKAKRMAEHESQRALGLEQQMSQRNKQIAGIIENLATRFYFSERPVAVAEDIKAEGLWQQLDKLISLLAGRLSSEQQAKLELQQAYQAETTKGLEQEALITTLQTALAAQTSQISKLEQALDEQKSILHQQQDKAQQALSSTLEKHQAELARITELEQQALELIDAKRQLALMAEQLTAKEALIAQLQINKSDEQVKVEPQSELVSQSENATPIELSQPEEIQPVLSDMQQATDNLVNEQSGGIAGKIKNLFGKPKQQPITVEPEVVYLIQEEVEPEPVIEEEPQPVNPVKKPFGKIRNLFGGKKQQAEETLQEEAKPEPEPLVEEQQPANPVNEQFGKIRNLFGRKKQQDEETMNQEITPEPLVEEQPVNSVKEQLSKIRNLFGGKKQQAEETIGEDIRPEPMIEQQPVNSAKEQFSKIKNLFAGKKREAEKTAEVEVQPAHSEKEQADEMVEKAAGISSQLKGLYRKFTTKSE